MIKVGDIMTTIEKKEYPYTVEVLEIYPCGTKARCLWTDTDDCGYKDYDLKALRHTSAREIAADVFMFFDIEEPSGMEFYSQKFIDWLKAESADYESFRDKTMEECDAEGIDIADLDSGDLWEFDRAGEKLGWLREIAEMIEEEIAEVKVANPTITVPVPNMYGKFVANPSTDPNYPGVDVEFIPDNDKLIISNPRVLFEAHDEALHAHLWTDTHKEDSTLKADFNFA